MTSSRFLQTRNDVIKGLATSYYPAQEGFGKVVVANQVYGSTGLYTNTIDLLKWAENFETMKVGSLDVFEMMAERSNAANGQDSTFARGQELRIYNGLETWSHGGTGPGYRAFLLRIPSEDFEVSITSNRTDFDTAKMAFALTDVFFETSQNYQKEDPLEWTPATFSELQQYTGEYQLQPGLIFSLRATEQGLTFASLGASHNDLDSLPQIGPREFQLNPTSDLALVFDEPVDGKSKGLGYRIGLHGTLDGHRVELSDFDASDVKLEDYTGTYFSKELNTRYELTLEDGTLYADHARRDAFPMTAYQPDLFAGAGPLMRVEFKRDEGREVVGFVASASLAEGVIFERLID